jgi:hypothetical protein
VEAEKISTLYVRPLKQKSDTITFTPKQDPARDIVASCKGRIPHLLSVEHLSSLGSNRILTEGSLARIRILDANGKWVVKYVTWGFSQEIKAVNSEDTRFTCLGSSQITNFSIIVLPSIEWEEPDFSTFERDSK